MGELTATALGHSGKRSKARGNVVRESGSTQRCVRNAKDCFLDPLASAYLAERTLAATDVGTARYKAGSSSDFN